MGSPPQDECSVGVNPVRSRVEHPLIGVRWKCSNVCSRGVLIDRALDLYTKVAMQSSGFCLYPTIFPGAVSAVAPHRSIPNSEVKRRSGEDTRRVTVWENSAVPGSIIPLQSSLLLQEESFLVFVGLCPDLLISDICRILSTPIQQISSEFGKTSRRWEDRKDLEGYSPVSILII